MPPPPISAGSKVIVSAEVGSALVSTSASRSDRSAAPPKSASVALGLFEFELVVEGGDDEACAGLLLEGAEIGARAVVARKAAGVGGDGVGRIAVAVEIDAGLRLVEPVGIAAVERGIREVGIERDGLDRPAIVGEHAGKDAGDGGDVNVRKDIGQRDDAGLSDIAVERSVSPTMLPPVRSNVPSCSSLLNPAFLPATMLLVSATVPALLEMPPPA